MPGQERCALAKDLRTGNTLPNPITMQGLVDESHIGCSCCPQCPRGAHRQPHRHVSAVCNGRGGAAGALPPEVGGFTPAARICARGSVPPPPLPAATAAAAACIMAGVSCMPSMLGSPGGAPEAAAPLEAGAPPPCAVATLGETPFGVALPAAGAETGAAGPAGLGYGFWFGLNPNPRSREGAECPADWGPLFGAALAGGGCDAAAVAGAAALGPVLFPGACPLTEGGRGPPLLAAALPFVSSLFRLGESLPASAMELPSG